MSKPERILWPRDAEITLLELVKQERVLWDRKHPNYSKRTLKREVIEKITNVLRLQYPELRNLTPDLLLLKFKNLRTYFMELFRKIQKAPSGSEGKPDVKWPLFDYAMFLVDTFNFTSNASSTYSGPVSPQEIVKVMTEMEAQKLRRRQNFSDDELKQIIHEAFKRRDIIMRKVDSGNTVRKKREAWEEVADGVNKVSSFGRDVLEIKKKFCDFKSLVKKKIVRSREAEQKGEDLEEFTPCERLLISYLSDAASYEIQPLDVPESETPMTPLAVSNASTLLCLEDEFQLTESEFDNMSNAEFITKKEPEPVNEATIDLGEYDADIDDLLDNEEINVDHENMEASRILVKALETLEKYEKKDPVKFKKSLPTSPIYTSTNVIKPTSSGVGKSSSNTSNDRSPKPKRIKVKNMATTSPIPSLSYSLPSINLKLPNDKILDNNLHLGKTVPHANETPSLESIFSKFFAAKAEDECDSDLLFFRGLLPDIKKLSDQNKRTFKVNMMSNLNDILDQQDKNNAYCALGKSSIGAHLQDEHTNALPSKTVVMNGHIDSSGELVVGNVEKASDTPKLLQDKRP